ncbi:hypothetical protein NDU88_000199 [Pleurodeles waltl]|uniref:Uncharacterized protein n=1 Tax=Pleurodeles waltl TaxID=8319 RepID=A0AAV7UPB7_PLEWA|nr:hypothetical protein NDU88_000199 [Pleurodeles waltl]
MERITYREEQSATGESRLVVGCEQVLVWSQSEEKPELGWGSLGRSGRGPLTCLGVPSGARSVLLETLREGLS